ncbi:hypothetical protein P5F08_04290 [Clostridium perfringens]|nr:hypothetical protein [Clostridium perfringens]
MKKKLLSEVMCPYVYTFGILGATGSGKTTLLSLLTTQSARKIVEKAVGETNSTLVERKIVVSEEYTNNNKIVVAVKKNDRLYKWTDFTQMLIKVCTNITLRYGKKPEIDKEKMLKDVEKELRKTIYSEFNNTKSDLLLSFLSEDDMDNVIENIKLQLEKSGFIEECYKIYCTAKNSLDKQEVKDNSQKLKNALMTTIGEFFDNLPIEIRQGLEEGHKSINKSLEEIFFRYFNKSDISNDGYYFYIIDLLNVENEKQDKFIQAFFNNNNIIIKEGNKLSIEVFCSEIVIYIPINQKILKLVKEDGTCRKVFGDKKGNVSLAFRDTQGFFHAGIDEGLVEEYAYNLVYGENDALILLNPLAGDTNKEKLKSLYSKVFESYNKDTPLFIINNKVDMFVDKIINDSIEENDDIFCAEIPKTNISESEIIQKVEEAKIEIEERVIKQYCKKVRNIKSLVCYFRKSSNLKGEVAKRYNLINSIEEIFKTTSSFLENNSNRIRIRVIDSEINVTINRDIIKDIFYNEVFSNKGVFFDYTMKKVISPSIENISNNLGITPHGNSYNALGRRLKVGQGYTSNIDESYYFSCKSFSINFPANLRNLITSKFANELLKSIKIEGGDFEDRESESMFLKSILEYIYIYDYSIYLLYNKAFLKAEYNGYYSFRKRFDDFLRYSLSFVYDRNNNIDTHVDAIEYMLKNASYKAIGYRLLLV